MERLTDKCWKNLDPWECCGQDKYCLRGCHDGGGCENGCIVPKLYARLAAYEDTGLTPEEARYFGRLVRGERMVTEEDLMASGVSPAEIQRLMDIVTAEAEGRLLVLPCKVGDTVYRLNRTPYGKRFMDAYPELEVYAYQVTTIYGEKPGLILFAHRLLNGSITTSFVTFSGKDFGKTVFLTREEAEAALNHERTTKEDEP